MRADGVGVGFKGWHSQAGRGCGNTARGVIAVKLTPVMPADQSVVLQAYMACAAAPSAHSRRGFYPLPCPP